MKMKWELNGKTLGALGSTLALPMVVRDVSSVWAPTRNGNQLSRVGNIPVVTLTTSATEADILRSYRLHANCYITKPVDLDGFLKVVKSIDNFWLSAVKLPRGARS